MTMPIHPCPKRVLIPLKFEVIFNYDTFFKVAQSYPHGPKLAQLTVFVFLRIAKKKKTGSAAGFGLPYEANLAQFLAKKN